MTIGEAIDRVDYLCENTYPDKTKKEWLSHLDGMIQKNLLTDAAFDGYNEETNADAVLLVPHPFDELYIHWLLCKIYLANQELEKYNNEAVTYGEAYQNFARWHRRTAVPTEKVRFKNYRE